MQNLMQMVKTGNFRPEKNIGTSLKPNFDNFIESSSDYSLLVYFKTLFEFKLIVVQNQQSLFGTGISERKYPNVRLTSSTVM